MFHVLGTVLPIFSIILLGAFLKARGILQPGFAGPANQIVYYVAIPAMFLNTISRAPFRTELHFTAAAGLLGALGLLAVVGLGAARALKVREGSRGTFLQSCFHGNIGYLSYAVAFYALGESHFAQTAILSTFLIVGQNFLAVWALTSNNPLSGPERPKWLLIRYTLHNPIILTIGVGVAWALLGIPMPRPVRQVLEMLSGMAFPTALLLIGASLSFKALRSRYREIAGIGILKLILMPLVGYAFMTVTRVPGDLMICGIILLATPPATVTYVMATELGGDPELAATSVSVVTLASALTYSLVLWILIG